MKLSKLDKAYVSPFDKFLFEFDARHEKSKSQCQEIEKYQRIAKLRDTADPQSHVEKIWNEF